MHQGGARRQLCPERGLIGVRLGQRARLDKRQRTSLGREAARPHSEARARAAGRGRAPAGRDRAAPASLNLRAEAGFVSGLARACSPLSPSLAPLTPSLALLVFLSLHGAVTEACRQWWLSQGMVHVGCHAFSRALGLANLPRCAAVIDPAPLSKFPNFLEES